MKKNEADRLRDIADVLDDHYNDFPRDCTNNESHWLSWAADEIRKVLFNSGFNAFNHDGTTTTHQFNEEDD